MSGTQIASNPVVNFANNGASGVTASPMVKALIVNQKSASGTAISGKLYSNISNDTNIYEGLFGKNSIMSACIKSFKAINKYSQLDVISLDDNVGGVQATGNVTFTGTTAGVAGTIYVTIGSKKKHKYTLNVAFGATPDQIGDALAAAILADTYAPFTSVNTSGDVAITFLHKGTIGNNISVHVEGSVTGITLATTAFAGGATDPVLTTLFDNIDSIKYKAIIYPCTYDLDVLETLVESRVDYDNIDLAGVGFISKTDSKANLVTLGEAYNSRALIIHGNEVNNNTLFKGSTIKEFDDVIITNFVAIDLLRLTPNAVIGSGYIASVELNDNIGGPSLASYPYYNTPLFDLPVIEDGDGFTRSEVKELKDAGVFVMSNNVAGTTLITDQVVTTYKTNALGIVDDSFKYLNYIRTYNEATAYQFTRLKAELNTRLTQGTSVAGYSDINEVGIKAIMKDSYIELSGGTYYLCPRGISSETGKDIIKEYENNLSINISYTTGIISISQILPILVQARIINVISNLTFNI